MQSKEEQRLMRGWHDQHVRLQSEQNRAEQEKARSGMPGAIRRNGKWTRERKDGPMAFQAKADWMVRDMAK